MSDYCQIVVSEAKTGEDFVAVAQLIIGAEMDAFGDMLRDRIMMRVNGLKGPAGTAAPSGEVRAIGEAMNLLQRLASN